MSLKCHRFLYNIKKLRKKVGLLSVLHTTLNIFCVTVFSVSFFPAIFSCSFLAVSIASILAISAAASSSPRCVYTLSVTPMSECPIRHCSVFGLMQSPERKCGPLCGPLSKNASPRIIYVVLRNHRWKYLIRCDSDGTCRNKPQKNHLVLP